MKPGVHKHQAVKMAETEPDTPLIAENVCKSEKQEQNKDEQIVPPDGGFWVRIEQLGKFFVNLYDFRPGLSWQAVS